MAEEPKLTYAASGVDYNVMDLFKVNCTAAGKRTAAHLEKAGFHELVWTRGESAYGMECLWADFILGQVEEGLGTKNKVAEAMTRMAVANEVAELLGTAEAFAKIAQCNFAMIVNDLVTLGFMPLAFSMHLAAGSTEWFKDEQRLQGITDGTEEACELAECTWGGGETSTLVDVVMPDSAVLAGSATGIVRPKSNIINPANLQHHDAIVIFESSGIHANGLSAARQIAGRVGYEAQLDDGRLFGEALLDPTIIYAKLVQTLIADGIVPHYAVNITGHGWRKLARATEPFVYNVEWVPEPQPVFRAIQEWGPVDEREMYENFNMGAGFAIFVAHEDVLRVIELATLLRIRAWNAGWITKDGDHKYVRIRPKSLRLDPPGVR